MVHLKTVQIKYQSWIAERPVCVTHGQSIESGTFDAFVAAFHSFTVSFQCSSIMWAKSTNVSFAFSDWIQQYTLSFFSAAQ